VAGGRALAVIVGSGPQLGQFSEICGVLVMSTMSEPSVCMTQMSSSSFLSEPVIAHVNRMREPSGEYHGLCPPNQAVAERMDQRTG
jgi:hypothetical protein